MVSEHKSFALLAKQMRRHSAPSYRPSGEPGLPAIADMIRRIESALLERRAA